MGIKITVQPPQVQTDGIVVPVKFAGMKPTDVQKASDIIEDLVGLVQGGRVNVLALAKLGMDLGLLK